VSQSTFTFGGDWTDEKLQRVHTYLERYITALKNQPFTLAYVDAFAGKGGIDEPVDDSERYLFEELNDREMQKFRQGSTRRALELQPGFDEYMFVEKNSKRAKELAGLRTEFKHISNRIEIEIGDCNEILTAYCQRDWTRRRSVVFLDPFGMQVNWKTMEALAATNAVDVWVLFPLGVAVNRLLTKQKSKMPDAWKQRLDSIFGCSDWEHAFYRDIGQLEMWDEKAGETKIASLQDVANFYNERLRSIFADVAKNPLPLYNSASNPLYLLCFACANKKGAPIATKIAQSILGK